LAGARQIQNTQLVLALNGREELVHPVAGAGRGRDWTTRAFGRGHEGRCL
jgi:hypothetical protein